jgi:hypothetical protein
MAKRHRAGGWVGQRDLLSKAAHLRTAAIWLRPFFKGGVFISE